jgi:hypothetical protein
MARSILTPTPLQDLERGAQRLGLRRVYFVPTPSWYALSDAALLVVRNLLALEGVWVSEALLLVKIA